MAATFDPSLASKIDEARLWLGDYHTNAVAGPVANALLQDATIGAKIAAYPFNEAVAQLASALISKYANAPDSYEEGGSLKLEWHSRLAAWKEIVAEARKAGAAPTTLYRPGIAIGVIGSPAMNAGISSPTGFRTN